MHAISMSVVGDGLGLRSPPIADEQGLHGALQQSPTQSQLAYNCLSFLKERLIFLYKVRTLSLVDRKAMI